MKLKLSCFFLIAICAIYLSSCQKDFKVSDNVNPAAALTSYSNYLDKIIELEAAGTGFDTVSVSFVHYDNIKRVIRIDDPNQVRTYAYFYNGSDTLPYKSSDIYVSSSQFDTTIAYHFYDAQRRNLKDSIIDRHFYTAGSQYVSAITITNYSYGINKIMGDTRSEEIIPSNPTSFFRDTAITDIRGNILQSKKYEFDGSVYQPYSVINYTYDTHLTPFTGLSMFKAHQNFPSGETTYFDYLSFYNKLTQVETITGLGQTVNDNYSYVYNSAGYPSILNQGSDVRVIFKYKIL